MAYTLHLIQIISSVALIGLVLLQRGQSDGGTTFGGEGASFTRRGAERFLFLLTITVAVIFAVSSLLVIIL